MPPLLLVLTLAVSCLYPQESLIACRRDWATGDALALQALPCYSRSSQRRTVTILLSTAPCCCYSCLAAKRLNLSRHLLAYDAGEERQHCSSRARNTHPTKAVPPDCAGVRCCYGQRTCTHNLSSDFGGMVQASARPRMRKRATRGAPARMGMGSMGSRAAVQPCAFEPPHNLSDFLGMVQA